MFPAIISENALPWRRQCEQGVVIGRIICWIRIRLINRLIGSFQNNNQILGTRNLSLVPIFLAKENEDIFHLCIRYTYELLDVERISDFPWQSSKVHLEVFIMDNGLHMSSPVLGVERSELIVSSDLSIPVSNHLSRCTFAAGQTE